MRKLLVAFSALAFATCLAFGMSGTAVAASASTAELTVTVTVAVGSTGENGAAANIAMSARNAGVVRALDQSTPGETLAGRWCVGLSHKQSPDGY